jgi:hypothetical protein
MNHKIPLKERGQALVVIAIAALVLFAFTALAIDGSIVFSDRRHSQNASDTAVLAAALAKVQNETVDHPLYGTVNWKQVGLDRAKDNSYDDADPVTEVQAKPCTEAIVFSTGVVLECKGLPVGAIESQYIHVGIKSVVNLSLAQVLGWKTITNYTTAVSRATEPETTNWYDGYGIAATHEGCWDNQNEVPFNIGGNSTSYVIGAGVLVSAVCPEDGSSIVVSGNSSQLDTTTGVCAPGEAVPANDEAQLGTPGLQDICNVPPPDSYTLPSEPKCLNEGEVIEVSNGVWVAKPGYYNNTFPDVQGGQATIKLTKGIYCLKDGLDMGAGWDLTTDMNGNNLHNPATEGVFFFVSGGDVEFNGGSSVFIHAISSSTNSDFQPEWLNLLMFIPNPANVHITGGSGSTFTGTILAPQANVTLQGTSDSFGGTVNLDAQIIADIVEITGNTFLNIIYNESNNATTQTNPGVALVSD